MCRWLIVQKPDIIVHPPCELQQEGTTCGIIKLLMNILCFAGVDSLLPSVPCNLSSVGMKLGCSHLIYHLQKYDRTCIMECNNFVLHG